MGVGLNPKDQLVENLGQVITTIKNRMRENEALMEQNQLEVNRLSSRSISVNNQLKRVADSFDTIPREDIRSAYEEALDVRTRMVAMQNQLEKLQESQRRLQEFHDTVSDVVSRLGDVSADMLPGDSPDPKVQKLSLAGEQIVRIVEAQESERQRLANALHDGPAQSLTNFILQAEICQRLFNRDPDRANTELNNLRSSASVSFQKIREFIFDLRPMMLDDLGLTATVRRHIENLDEHEGFDAEFGMTGAERRLPKHVEVIMFRGLQQLIMNTRELLAANSVKVSLHIGDDQVRGVVEDNGRGFDPSVVLDRSQGDHPLQNLVDLQERVELMNGELAVFSEEGAKGSRFEIVLPFSENDMNI